MKNGWGETVKPQYEVNWRTYDYEHNPNARQDRDLISIEFSPADCYKEAVTIAKRDSLRIGEEVQGGYGKGELVEVRIICFFEDSDSSYNQAWFEYYENGKKTFRDND